MIDLNQKIDKDLKVLQRQIKQAAAERDESATPMESHSDQSRQIAEQLHNSLLDEKKRLLELKGKVTQYKSIFYIHNLGDGSIKKYFIVPNGLGGTQEGDTILLSEKTPLAKYISGAKRGHLFELNGQRFRIEKVEENK